MYQKLNTIQLVEARPLAGSVGYAIKSTSIQFNNTLLITQEQLYAPITACI